MVHQKYHDRKPDVIIAVGLRAHRSSGRCTHKVSFPDTPIVFCAICGGIPAQLRLDTAFTGFWPSSQPEGTLIAALHLLPGTKHVVVVGGVGRMTRYLEAIARESFHKYESSLNSRIFRT